MKKLGVVLASALAAGLFFGCSNDSDDNNMGLLLAAAGSNGGSSSITANFPENVGANELAGKSFQFASDSYNRAISFDNNTVTFTTTISSPEDQENGTRAYKMTNIITKRYSYNAETKNLYYTNSSSSGKTIYTNDANEKFEQPSMTFSTEEEYSTKMKDLLKKLNKFTGNESTDEELNKTINASLRMYRSPVYQLSSQYNLPTAYTDENCETPLTPDQISFYNKYNTMQEKANERTIECHAYKLENGNLKLSNSGNLPAGIKFGGIYNGTYDFSADIKNNGISVGNININVFEIIDPNNSLGAKDFTPSISFNGSSFKVTSASDNSVTGIWKVSDLISEKITLKLENETTTEKTTVTIKMQEGDYETTFGTFEIPYNKALPDYYTTYTKCE